MLRRSSKILLMAGALTAGLLAPASIPAAQADHVEFEFGPPWCGTAMNDAAGNLPDGTDADDPAGSFPHIPYYAIKCTLDSIDSDEIADRMEIEVIGQSAAGHDMYSVVINALETPQQRRDYRNWDKARDLMMTDPAAAQARVDAAGTNIKTPIYIQGAVHGNEYEGVDANIQLIERLATTPRGEDPEVDAILDNVIVVFNVIQNPDGRIAGTRANSNGFDLNRDFLTQSQPETRNSIRVLQEWLAPEVLDFHGYTTPLLNEGTTKPHNPSIEYDLWLKWNQPRLAANEAALAADGYDMQIPYRDWCAGGDDPNPDGLCDDGNPPGPAVAESWDDWGPFYLPMYSQHVGLDGATVEMCRSVDAEDACGGREGAREQQYIVGWSTMLYLVDNGPAMMHDMLENYKRGVANADRPECCPPPFDVDNNWMLEYPEAYMIPADGNLQRSKAEVVRLIDWLLFNEIKVRELTEDITVDGMEFEAGDYYVPMAQVRRGLADTALRIGVDISDRITALYAPPAAWSHGYLWGADVYPVERGTDFDPANRGVWKTPRYIGGGIEAGYADYYAMEIDSPTAVRFMNDLIEDGWEPQLALDDIEGVSRTLGAGSMVFPATPENKHRLGDLTSNTTGLEFYAVREAGMPELDEVEGVPRIAVLTGGNTQEIWALRNLGFEANPVSNTTINTAESNPLAGYDVIYNMGNWPNDTGGNNPTSFATARARLAEFFAEGGGYIGAGSNGANFVNASGQAAGFAPSTSTGCRGCSGIVYWDNVGGEDSVITGAYPDVDTALMDPPTWFTAVPPSFTVDGRLLESDFFAAGLWPDNGESSAGSSAIVTHGTNTAGTSRMTVFAMNPLYRADPEREWPMVSAAAYWSDR